MSGWIGHFRTSGLRLCRLRKNSKFPEMICGRSEKRKWIGRCQKLRTPNSPMTALNGALGSCSAGICGGAHGQAEILIAQEGSGR